MAQRAVSRSPVGRGPVSASARPEDSFPRRRVESDDRDDIKWTPIRVDPSHRGDLSDGRKVSPMSRYFRVHVTLSGETPGLT